MMHNPPHPGQLLLEECIKPLGLSITAAAKALKISRVTLSEIVNGKSGISADMAVKISRVFGSTPDFWMRLQDIHELWQAEKGLKHWKPKVSFVPPPV